MQEEEEEEEEEKEKEKEEEEEDRRNERGGLYSSLSATRLTRNGEPPSKGCGVSIMS